MIQGALLHACAYVGVSSVHSPWQNIMVVIFQHWLCCVSSIRDQLLTAMRVASGV